MDWERYDITKTEEYQEYMKALCRLASGYVSKIRVQFAEKAFEKFQNETIRKLVLEYGREAEKLDADRLRDFLFVSDNGATTPECLNDTCLNNSREYATTIKFLFEISLK